MTSVPQESVDGFLDSAVVGDTRRAVRLALDLLDQGVPEDVVISGLLAGAQRSVGDRWHRNTATVADEHLATGAAESALHALASAMPRHSHGGLVVVACAEGDWHAIAAHMFSEQLRSRGVNVAFLGASTPVEHVASFLERHRPDALAVSCNLPLFFRGVARLTAAAHDLGVPVLAGGRALGTSPSRALLLGADGWAPDVDDAMSILEGWRSTEFRPDSAPIQLDPIALALDANAERLADAAFDDLVQRFPPMADYDQRSLDRTREDLAFIVRFVAAAQLVDDESVLTTFLDWLDVLLESRGVPTRAIVGGLESLQPLLDAAGDEPGRLGRLGVSFLTDRTPSPTA
jgi:methanogenic corrinoid protein MtbC1